MISGPAATAYRRDAISGVDGGECDQLFAVTWPSDVDHLKARLAFIADSMDAGVKACPNLPQAERNAWNQFLAQWRPFAAKKTPTFGSYNEWITACSNAHTIDALQVKLSPYCKLPGPGAIKGANVETANALAGAIKYAGVAIAALALVGGAVYLVGQVKPFLPSKKKP